MNNLCPSSICLSKELISKVFNDVNFRAETVSNQIKKNLEDISDIEIDRIRYKQAIYQVPQGNQLNLTNHDLNKFSPVQLNSEAVTVNNNNVANFNRRNIKVLQ